MFMVTFSSFLIKMFMMTGNKTKKIIQQPKKRLGQVPWYFCYQLIAPGGRNTFKSD